MEPMTLIALLGAAAISSAGALYANSQNIKYAEEANDLSISLANTAHQREVRDLRAAGLNPILSATGSGSATPQLKVPGIENPVESVGNSADSLASAMNGLTKAEIQSAQAEASSAQSTAIQQQYMIAPVKFQADADMMSASNDVITEMARAEALTGVPDSQLFDPNSVYYLATDEARKTYDDLVQQYRNEIESGRYLASKEHAIYEDAKAGARLLIDGVNSASGFRRAASAIRRDNSAIKRDNWEMTRPRGQQNKVKHK